VNALGEGRIDSEAAAQFYAQVIHHGDKDKQGRPYWEHLSRVVALLDSETDRIVGWLHDVLEDHPERESCLKSRVDSDVWAACVFLTRVKDQESYAEYIERIYALRNTTVEHQRAYRVKLADLCDHLRAGCPDKLVRRYVDAIGVMHGVNC